jgi:hypothetical protein
MRFGWAKVVAFWLDRQNWGCVFQNWGWSSQLWRIPNFVGPNNLPVLSLLNQQTKDATNPFA